MSSKYPIAYAVYNNDLEIRMNSTSGGIFTALAEYFMDKYDAKIYGAAFDENCNVHHICVDGKEDIKRLRGSKYPQSKVIDAYKNVKHDLDSGKYVLFTGTPCQVVALHNFLRKDYDNLFCMDFVCHGVASDGIWRSYIEQQTRTHGKIKNITFKKKVKGWKKWYFQIEFEDGTIKQRRGYMTMFMASYLEYGNIRPSCYECHFKGLERVSDFTISDCWGIGEQDQEMNDNKGLSALLLQNERAVKVFEELKGQVTCKKYDAQALMEGNWTTFRSVTADKKRSNFFSEAARNGGYKALKKYYAPDLKDWARYRLHVLQGKEK